jgi:hypothetical protein
MDLLPAGTVHGDGALLLQMRSSAFISGLAMKPEGGYEYRGSL